MRNAVSVTTGLGFARFFAFVLGLSSLATVAASQAESEQRESLYQQLDEIHRQLDHLEQDTGEARSELTWLELRAQHSARDLEAAHSRPHSKPAPGDEQLKGFFMIPGTQSALRISGFSKVDAIYDFRPAGNPDKLVTSTIPTGPRPHKGNNFNIHAKQTTMRLEARRPTPFGGLHFFLENDFFESETSYEYRLTAAYGQLGNAYAGFGYTAFADIAALPNTLDGEGPNGSIFLRNATLRYHWTPSDRATLTLSAERPVTEFSLGPEDAQAASRVPDMVGVARFEHGRGHVQAAALLRYLLVDDGADDDATWGGGAQLAGVVNVYRHDSVQFQVFRGTGIGRYVNDLGGSGMDAVMDLDGSLHRLRSTGGYIAYTRQWNKNWSSNLVASILSVENSSLLRDSDIADTSVRETRYAALNLLWSPNPSILTGVEVLYGYIHDQAGLKAETGRIQASVKYNFTKP